MYEEFMKVAQDAMKPAMKMAENNTALTVKLLQNNAANAVEVMQGNLAHVKALAETKDVNAAVPSKFRSKFKRKLKELKQNGGEYPVAATGTEKNKKSTFLASKSFGAD